jgi:hypothetical protein
MDMKRMRAQRMKRRVKLRFSKEGLRVERKRGKYFMSLDIPC